MAALRNSDFDHFGSVNWGCSMDIMKNLYSAFY